MSRSEVFQESSNVEQGLLITFVKCVNDEHEFILLLFEFIVQFTDKFSKNRAPKKHGLADGAHDFVNINGDFVLVMLSLLPLLKGSIQIPPFPVATLSIADARCVAFKNIGILWMHLRALLSYFLFCKLLQVDGLSEARLTQCKV